MKKGEPLVTRRQVTELNDHYPFEYVRASYVAERFEFTFENKMHSTVKFDLLTVLCIFYFKSSLIWVVEIPGVLSRYFTLQ